jgi:hypothetical protein
MATVVSISCRIISEYSAAFNFLVVVLETVEFEFSRRITEVRHGAGLFEPIDIEPNDFKAIIIRTKLTLARLCRSRFQRHNRSRGLQSARRTFQCRLGTTFC